MTISLQATAGGSLDGATVTCSITIPTGVYGGCLIVVSSSRSNSAAVTTATFDGIAMGVINSGYSGGGVAAIAAFFFRNPNPGAKTVSITWNSSNNCSVIALLYNNVDTILGPLDATAVGSYGAASPTSLTISSAIGHLALALLAGDSGSGNPTFTAGTGETKDYEKIGTNSTSCVCEKNGAASVAMAETMNLGSWNALGISLRPVVAGRGRLLAYTFQMLKGRRAIKDSRNQVVPFCQMRPDGWVTTLGVFPPTPVVAASYVDDDPTAYIEAVRYDGESDESEFETNRQNLPDVMLARAAMKALM